MSGMTEQEWAEVQAALVKGGLRECIDSLLHARSGGNVFTGISDRNRAILYRAYDDGEGRTIHLVPHATEANWFSGVWGDEDVMEGVEIEGTLYSVCPHSGGGLATVLIGTEIEENVVGPTFHSYPEARAYIRGLTAK